MITPCPTCVMALRKRLASSLGNVMVEGRALGNIIFETLESTW
jgi:hypothetical protein